MYVCVRVRVERYDIGMLLRFKASTEPHGRVMTQAQQFTLRGHGGVTLNISSRTYSIYSKIKII